MQMRVFATGLFLAMALSSSGHPPVSVVIDGRGNVYYSDLKQVWRLAPDGTKEIVVPAVHTHELYLDAQGNLFGEHLWYEGEKIDKWGYYVWKRTPDGKVSLVIPRSEGVLKNYSFARDRNGTMYFAAEPEKSRRSEVWWRAPSGRLHAMARGFRDIRWIHATPAGTIFLVDDGDLVRIKGGRVTRLAPKLGRRWDRHALMGIWSDSAENAYVADMKHRQVKRISPDGTVTMVAKSTFPWSPTGGAFAPNGDLWLLETNVTNQVRVREIARRR
jgi:sugar lactone lactonase YvrE